MKIPDNAKNTATDVVGTAKAAIGHITGADDLEIAGQIDQAAATARKNGEDEQDLFG